MGDIESCGEHAKPSPPGPAEWADWPDEKLLELRLCDLRLTVEGSQIAEQIRQLNDELAERGLLFRPHFWLSDEWFSPDGVPGIAVPFYLAHPRLARLELAQMLEVEGGTPDACMRILRHEAGHALENAYRLRRRRDRQAVFGRSTQAYPKYYTPKPYSKSYVLHLDMWYAQSHPDEDFAETFAVWLAPQSQWRQRYADWPALKKLEYMDGLMASLAGVRPSVRTREKVDPISRLRKTLKEHYDEKRKRFGIDHPTFYDRDLRRLFSDDAMFKTSPTAAGFIKRLRKQIRRYVAKWTGEYQYTIDRLLDDMTRRCRELDLHVAGPEEQVRIEFTVLLTLQTMNYLHSGRHRLAL
ncbi:MAG TPA: putative zinc-binding metallopeptidase [Nitrospira sp.]|nr:putative zinc-binding metallopeptidase [Nitrospira sp.]